MSRFMKDFNGEKIFCLEYDKETLKDIVIEKQEEIERLNNIINKLENWLSKEYMSGCYEELYRIGLLDSYNKLQELKGDEND